MLAGLNVYTDVYAPDGQCRLSCATQPTMALARPPRAHFRRRRGIRRCKVRWLISTLLAVYLLHGCASGPAQRSAGEEWQREIDRVSASHNQTLQADRALDAIRQKAALYSVRDTTFEMLANNSLPTAEEQAAILHFARLREPYIAALQSIHDRYGNPYRHIARAQYQSTSAVWADLFNGTITYGEAARRRQQIDAIVSEARERMRSALATEANAIERANLERLSIYQREQQRLQQSAPKLVPLLPTPVPVRLQTTCTSIGNMLYCN